jgi:hypothetical protein
MKRMILFCAIYCLTSIDVSGQYSQRGLGRSAVNDTTTLQTSVLTFKSLKIPLAKDLFPETAQNHNLWQPEGKNKIRLDTIMFRNESYKYKHFEIGVTYQSGFMNTVKTNYITSNKFREWKFMFNPF